MNSWPGIANDWRGLLARVIELGKLEVSFLMPKMPILINSLRTSEEHLETLVLLTATLSLHPIPAEWSKPESAGIPN